VLGAVVFVDDDDGKAEFHAGSLQPLGRQRSAQVYGIDFTRPCQAIGLNQNAHIPSYMHKILEVTWPIRLGGGS
ncbi:MAG TPA: hypothetical protein PLA28_15710, partial [Ottowia sp.]|nr:hypothetical protein [Ottowia sp.]